MNRPRRTVLYADPLDGHVLTSVQENRPRTERSACFLTAFTFPPVFIGRIAFDGSFSTDRNIRNTDTRDDGCEGIERISFPARQVVFRRFVIALNQSRKNREVRTVRISLQHGSFSKLEDDTALHEEAADFIDALWNIHTAVRRAAQDRCLYGQCIIMYIVTPRTEIANV